MGRGDSMSRDAGYEVVVVAYQSRAPLTSFLESLGSGPSVIVVDNSIEVDDLGDLAQRFPNVRHVDAGGNLGFSAGANLGAQHSEAEFLVFMNPDTLPTEAHLEQMVFVLGESPSVASCGAVGIDTAGGGAQPTIPRVLAHSLGLHRLFPMIGIYYYPKNGGRSPAGWIAGSCLAIRRSDFEAVGGFDESYFVFMSDVELGRMLSLAGRSQLLLGDVTVPHLDGGSSDIPSEWVWSQRGKGWAQFLYRTMPRWKGIATGSVLVGGYLARAILYTAARRSVKASEVATYARSFIVEWRSSVSS
jgi:N-acetylglucosaminyl-diphospho-decaprenol L-rhamnosyltransferase